MDGSDRALASDDLHAGHVDRTLKELQRMVKEHENALNLASFHPPPCTTKRC
jgi:hypothetical protein